MLSISLWQFLDYISDVDILKATPTISKSQQSFALFMDFANVDTQGLRVQCEPGNIQTAIFTSHSELRPIRIVLPISLLRHPRQRRLVCVQRTRSATATATAPPTLASHYATTSYFFLAVF